VRQAHDRVRRAASQHIAREAHHLAALRSRPALSAPHAGLAARRDEVRLIWARADRGMTHRVERARDEVRHQLARARTLSPLATLRRGYAVLQTSTGQVLASVAATTVGAELTVRMHDGRLGVRVDANHPDPAGDPDE
ncbi:MAG: exodeoxyribonuclease VII large subunit, partial [Nocardioidaceae bacterium]|nr:exodeoxyribonuclease VII large subunit [Nocardioidaceae bacterium]